MNKEELKALSAKELKAKCKDLGLAGYSRLSEDDIVQLILDQTDEQPEDIDGDEYQTGSITFKKKIKGAFGFNGQTFKGSTFELTGEEASHDKIKNAIKNGLIEIK